MSIIVKLLVSFFLAALGTYFAYNSLVLSKKKRESEMKEYVSKQKEVQMKKLAILENMKIEYPLGEFNVNNSMCYLLHINEYRMSIKILHGDTLYPVDIHPDYFKIVIDSNYKQPVITRVEDKIHFSTKADYLPNKIYGAIIKYYKGDIETYAFTSQNVEKEIK